MPSCYMYAGDRYCERCATDMRANIRVNYPSRIPPTPDDLSSYTGDRYPRGPLLLERARENVLQCHNCETLLLNPLSERGLERLRNRLSEYSREQRALLNRTYGLGQHECQTCRDVTPDDDQNSRCFNLFTLCCERGTEIEWSRSLRVVSIRQHSD